jgi:hypothetical protein
MAAVTSLPALATLPVLFTVVTEMQRNERHALT